VSFCEGLININDDKIIHLKVDGNRSILTHSDLNSTPTKYLKGKNDENFNDLKFNVQIIKNSTDYLIQSIINNNKYLIEFEKKKLKDNTCEDEEYM